MEIFGRRRKESFTNGKRKSRKPSRKKKEYYENQKESHCPKPMSMPETRIRISFHYQMCQKKIQIIFPVRDWGPRPRPIEKIIHIYYQTQSIHKGPFVKTSKTKAERRSITTNTMFYIQQHICFEKGPQQPETSQ